MRSWFGDATRSDLLHSAGIDEAALFVVAIDEPDQAVGIVEHLKSRHPHLRVLARAFDRGHEYRLREAGADYAVRETFRSALEIGTRALRDLGVHPFKAEQLRATFEAAEEDVRDDLYAAWRRRPEGERMGRDHHQLFMQLDAAMADAMRTDRDDPPHPRGARLDAAARRATPTRSGPTRPLRTDSSPVLLSGRGREPTGPWAMLERGGRECWLAVSFV